MDAQFSPTILRYLKSHILSVAGTWSTVVIGTGAARRNEDQVALAINKWADSVVALRGKTGELVWGFQLVHHDLWDYDTASAPLLAILKRAGKETPVVIAGNKTGFLYVLDRDTGLPVFPVEERPVPQSDVPGEVTSPTHPFPLAPPPLAPQKLSAADVWGTIPADVDVCQKWLLAFRNEGISTPPSLQGTLVVPGKIGGMTWSSYALDPERSLLLVPTNNIAAVAKLIPSEKFEDAARSGEDGDYEPQTGAPTECSGGFSKLHQTYRAVRRHGVCSARLT